MKQVLICAAFALSVTVAAWGQNPGGGRPGGQPQPNPGATAGGGQFVNGSIVNVDAAGNAITLRTGVGANAREQMFRVNDATKYFGTDRQALTDGLRFNGLKAGTDVWYQLGTGANANMLSNLSLFDPTVRNRDKDK